MKNFQVDELLEVSIILKPKSHQQSEVLLILSHIQFVCLTIHTILSFLHYHPPYLQKQKITNKIRETNLFQSLSFLFGVSKNDDAVIQVGWTIGT